MASSVQAYLEQFVNYESHLRKVSPRQFKLTRVKKLLSLLGNPQQYFKTLHVAGTKGKGSTCAFAAAILCCAGYKVGLYTSPHLQDFKERIRVLKPSLRRTARQDPFWGKATENDLRRSLEKIKPAIQKIQREKLLGQLTYFEVLTVLAVYHFYRSKVDFAVLETGLGGRLDATNAVDAIVCGITPISLEHTRQLGNTTARIAFEKAGIIKTRNQAVVIARQKKEAAEVIQERCRAVGVKSRRLGKDIRRALKTSTIQGQIFCVTTLKRNYSNLTTRLLGDHQMDNASVAVGMVELLPEKIDKRAIVQGVKETRWPGRCEVIRKKPLVILDGAHNPASCRELVRTIKALLPRKRIILILGISEDKDRPGMAHELIKIANSVIATQANHPRSYRFTLEELRRLFPKKNVSLTKTVGEAWAVGQAQASPRDVILITGSLFVVAEARKICLP